MEQIMIPILLFVTLTLFGVGIYLYLGYHKERSNMTLRIRQIGHHTDTEESTGGFHTIKTRLTRIALSLGDLLKPKKEGELSHVRKTFLKAGYRKEEAPIIFLGTKAFLGILFLIAFSLTRLWSIKILSSLYFILFSLFFALIGYYLPDAWLRLKIKRRREKIVEGFPDALDLMVVCVESGNGLDAAISRVGEEMKLNNSVLSEEFKLLSLEFRAGKSREEALRNLALRTDSEDVNSLVLLLIQTEKFGTNIAQAMRVHSDSMRTKRQQRAEEMAAKLPVKLLFPLIVFIFPSLFVAIMGPAVIRIIRLLLPQMGGQ